MRGRGWPGKSALAAALALHLALAALAFDWANRHGPLNADERPVPVMLVLTETPSPRSPSEERAPPPPHPTAPSVPDPERAAPAAPGPEAPTVAGAPPPEPAAEPPGSAPSERTAAPSAPPTAPSPPPNPAPPARARKPPPEPAKPTPGTATKAEPPGERAKREAHAGAAPASAEPKAGVAVYDVVVDASGKIRSITLAHSSGTTSFDASGEAMIRNGMGFEVPPADPSQEQRLFTVSIAFTPEGR